MDKDRHYFKVYILYFFSIILILFNTSAFAARSDVETFVSRFYQQSLSREPDAPGLEGWVNALINGSLSGDDVAYGFIFSQEFIDRNTSNEEFVTILYRAFFGREPDSVGYNGWLSAVNIGLSREDALNGFIYSREFENLCANYGIIPFSNSTNDDGNDDSGTNDDGNDDDKSGDLV